MQSHLIGDLLSAFGINKVVSSDSIRCVATVSPYAASQELALEAHQNLSELGWEFNNKSGLKLIRKLAMLNQPVVICGHRPALPALAQAIGDEFDFGDIDASLPPAGMLIIHRDLRNKAINSVEKFIVAD
jgi:8-oxo-dGTP diphosphatase